MRFALQKFQYLILYRGKKKKKHNVKFCIFTFLRKVPSFSRLKSRKILYSQVQYVAYYRRSKDTQRIYETRDGQTSLAQLRARRQSKQVSMTISHFHSSLFSPALRPLTANTTWNKRRIIQCKYIRKISKHRPSRFDNKQLTLRNFSRA